MEGWRFFNDIVAEPLEKYNYEDWFEWVKDYLISQDLWKVTSRSARPERYRVKDYARWRRKSAAALHVIRLCCGPHNLPFLRGASEAKAAWDIFHSIYSAPPPPRPPRREELEMGILYKAISENNWTAAKAFIDAHPNSLDPELAATTGETPLHVAVKLGHVNIVENLVRLVPPKYLETPDSSHNTPLLIAATYSGVIPIARCLINKNSNTIEIPFARAKSFVPATVAFYNGLNEMGHYLYSVTPLHVFKPQNRRCGPSLLKECLYAGNLDIALDLLQRCKELLFAVDDRKFSTIENIAFNPYFSSKKSQLPFWKRSIYQYIKIPSTTATKDFRVDIQQEGESNKGHQGPGLLLWLISRIYNLLDRKAEILNLLPGFRFKHVIATMRPDDFNTLLHEAAMLAPASYLNRISGLALQMQRELQWFKAVENMVDPAIRIVINDQGFNPLNFFKVNHSKLRKEGEKWMKATSSSCSVVGALIVTIMFAVAFTVPGGNNQTSGYPIFLEKKLFKVFLIADTLSLFSSTTSVLTFLGILTSRYEEEDFLYSLPRKLIIGLSTLFLSTATMMIAFSTTIIIMSQHSSPWLWTLLPVMLLAGVPITLFVLLQFPLLVKIISSTYVQTILKKKVVMWP